MDNLISFQTHLSSLYTKCNGLATFTNQSTHCSAQSTVTHSALNCLTSSLIQMEMQKDLKKVWIDYFLSKPEQQKLRLSIVKRLGTYRNSICHA